MLNQISNRTDMDAVRQWASDYFKASEENKLLSEDKPKVYNGQRKTRCQCGEEVEVLQVKKDGINQGRLFASCVCCHRFQWLDMPLCKKCGERKYQAQVKHGKRAGKWFMACPNRCKISFRWLDRRLRGGWYEVV